MVVTPATRSRLAPWAGLIAAMVGVLLQHQGIGDALHFDCGFDARLANLIVGAVALLLMALGAWISWRVARAEAQVPDSTRRFIAHMSLMAVALFALMVIWQTMAGLIVPACPA